MTETKVNLQPAVIDAIRDRKGRGIVLVDMSHIPGAGVPGFVICQGTSTMNVAGIADNVRQKVQELTGRKPVDYEGYRESRWIVIDYGELMVHVFMPEERARYNLEELWADASVMRIPDDD